MRPALLVLAFLAAPFYSGGANRAHRVIRTWDEIHGLTPEQAQQQYPVHLRAIVTYAPPRTGYFWAQDKTAGGFAWMPQGKQQFSLGETLDLYGVTDPGKFGPCLKVTEYHDLGPGTLPKPVETPLQSLLSGSEDGRRIQISGRLVAVNGARDSRSQTKMVLSAEGNRIAVYLNGPPLQDSSELLDSEVRLTAISSVTFNEQRQFTGIVLNLARPEDLTVLIPGSKDIPVSKIDNLLRYQPGVGIKDSRARIQGIATYYDVGKLLVIQDGSRAAFVQPAAPDHVAVGSWCSVLGYPRARAYTPILIEARAYSRSSKVQIAPLSLTADEALSGRFDALLVRMTADLVDRSYSREQQLLTLRAGANSFVAQFPENAKDHVSDLQSGSTLELTGVLRLQGTGLSNAPQSFRLLLRGGSDIVVLKHPSWLSRTRLFYIALGLAALVVCVLVWVSVLRRQVLRQTRKIWEQRRREAQLEESHRVLVENASDLIFTVSLDGKFLSANLATVRVTGRAISELLNIYLSELVVPAERDSFNVWFSTLVKNSHNMGEFDISTLSGSIRAVDLSAHVSNLNPKQTQVEFVGRDVTERKRTHAALQQARLAAEAANAAKTRFLANMSHEIRTPLNAILGTADLLAETNLTSDQQTYVATFQSSGNNLLALLNSLLDLTKVESGQLQLESISFAVENLVADIVTMMAGRANGNEIKFSSRIDATVPGRVVGDPNRLGQILANLLGNAVKFTERGEIKLEVTASPEPATDAARERVVLRFTVKDTGIGISPEKLGLIFERFTQADNSITRRFGGTGLGLSISRALAQAMGGTIDVVSGLGQGSEFTLTLPLGLPLPNETHQPVSISYNDKSDLVEALRKRPAAILVAEDNEANRLVIEAYLKDLPFQVGWAQNGLRAVEMEEAAVYDLILMDIEMPEMDGYEATRRIHERRRKAGLPPISVLALTAHAFEEERAKAELAGCSELLTKPIRRKVLFAALARNLSQSVAEIAEVS